MTSWKEQCPKDLIRSLREEKDRIASQTGRQTWSLLITKAAYDKYYEAGLIPESWNVTIAD